MLLSLSPPYSLRHFDPSIPITYSHNAVNSLRNQVTRTSKRDKPTSDTPEPCQIVLGVLAGNPNVHTPHARDDVHRQHDRTQNRQFAEDIRGLLRALVHADVDLGEVVAVGSTEQTEQKEGVLVRC